MRALALLTQSRRWVLPIVAVVAVGMMGMAALREPASGEFRASGQPRPLPAGGSLPSVDEAGFEGILVGLRGTPVVVNVWASWCAPCRTEMPLLQRAADTYRGDVVILGVASKDDPDAARRFLEEFDLTYPNVFDETGRIRVALGLTAYPTTYMFDRAGRLVSTVRGGISEQRLSALIEGTRR